MCNVKLIYQFDSLTDFVYLQMHSYKITPRAVNAHAYVNAVFRFEVDTSADFLVTSKPIILYGGINPSFVSFMGLCPLFGGDI